MRSGVLTCLIALAVLAGCGSDDSSSEAPALLGPSDAAIKAEKPKDQQIGFDLRGYLLQTCPARGSTKSAPGEKQELKDALTFCESLESITVDGGKVTIQTNLDGDSTTPGVGDIFCSAVQGSDVADPVAGHTLLDKDGGSMKVCPAQAG